MRAGSARHFRRAAVHEPGLVNHGPRGEFRMACARGEPAPHDEFFARPSAGPSSRSWAPRRMHGAGCDRRNASTSSVARAVVLTATLAFLHAAMHPTHGIEASKRGWRPEGD